MKKLKRLSRKQKDLLTVNGLDYSQFLLERQDHNTFTFVKRDKSETITLFYK